MKPPSFPFDPKENFTPDSCSLLEPVASEDLIVQPATSISPWHLVLTTQIAESQNFSDT
jgi:hypothetical protein